MRFSFPFEIKKFNNLYIKDIKTECEARDPHISERVIMASKNQ